MRALIILITSVTMQISALAGIETDIPTTNRVVLKSYIWTPTPEETQKALISIQRFLDKPTTTNDWEKAEIKQILANSKKYRVQFVGTI